MNDVPADRWVALGTPTERLFEARLQAHHAVQVVAAVGHVLVPARSDDSHAAMTWDRSLGALVGEPVPGSGPRRVGLRVRDLALLALEEDGSVADTLGLGRRTLSEAYGWAAASFAASTPGSGPELVRPGYDLPVHPIEEGRAFDVSDAVSLAELDRWYQNAAGVLEDVASAEPGASRVRCWPHHFDIATLIALDRDEAGEGDEGSARTVGAGMAPGDGSYREPYLYVSPFPAPEGGPPDETPAHGTWHTSGWFGAVLTGSRLAARGGDEAQRETVRAFLDSAIAACRALARG